MGSEYDLSHVDYFTRPWDVIYEPLNANKSSNNAEARI